MKTNKFSLSFITALLIPLAIVIISTQPPIAADARAVDTLYAPPVNWIEVDSPTVKKGDAELKATQDEVRRLTKAIQKLAVENRREAAISKQEVLRQKREAADSAGRAATDVPAPADTVKPARYTVWQKLSNLFKSK